MPLFMPEGSGSSPRLAGLGRAPEFIPEGLVGAMDSMRFRDSVRILLMPAQLQGHAPCIMTISRFKARCNCPSIHSRELARRNGQCSAEACVS